MKMMTTKNWTKTRKVTREFQSSIPRTSKEVLPVLDSENIVDCVSLDLFCVNYAVTGDVTPHGSVTE